MANVMIEDGWDAVCFDFDGVLAESTWPMATLGEPIEEGVELLVELAAAGYEITIYTARPLSHEERIWRWLKEQTLDHIVYDVICGKPRAGVYIDDKAHRFERGK